MNIYVKKETTRLFTQSDYLPAYSIIYFERMQTQNKMFQNCLLSLFMQKKNIFSQRIMGSLPSSVFQSNVAIVALQAHRSEAKRTLCIRPGKVKPCRFIQTVGQLF